MCCIDQKMWDHSRIISIQVNKVTVMPFTSIGHQLPQCQTTYFEMIGVGVKHTFKTFSRGKMISLIKFYSFCMLPLSFHTSRTVESVFSIYGVNS